jgi:hypothetical protein
MKIDGCQGLIFPPQSISSQYRPSLALVIYWMAEYYYFITQNITIL